MAVDYNRRVLVVDDDEETRGILRTALVHRALDVDEAAGGAEALALLREKAYAVVLLDIVMPDIDGYAVLDALHATQGGHNTVVLVVSGADRAAFARLDARRIHGVVRKPFEPLEIAALVQSCAEIRGRTSYDAMTLATMIGGAPLLTLLS
jgi:CheY-like chemotaxis protein